MKSWAFALLIGCGGRVDVVAGDGGVDALVPDTFAASDTLASDVTARDTAVSDTLVLRDTSPDPSQFPVTAAQADCLGVNRPECAGCHFRGGNWYMRPRDVPPPPPTIPPADYAGCGVTPP